MFHCIDSDHWWWSSESQRRVVEHMIHWVSGYDSLRMMIKWESGMSRRGYDSLSVRIRLVKCQDSSCCSKCYWLKYATRQVFEICDSSNHQTQVTSCQVLKSESMIFEFKWSDTRHESSLMNLDMYSQDTSHDSQSIEIWVNDIWVEVIKHWNTSHESSQMNMSIFRSDTNRFSWTWVYAGQTNDESYQLVFNLNSNMIQIRCNENGNDLEVLHLDGLGEINPRTGEMDWNCWLQEMTSDFWAGEMRINRSQMCLESISWRNNFAFLTRWWRAKLDVGLEITALKLKEWSSMWVRKYQ